MRWKERQEQRDGTKGAFFWYFDLFIKKIGKEKDFKFDTSYPLLKHW